MVEQQLDSGKNGARGIAALIVCIDHAYGLFLEPHFGGAVVASHFVALAANQAVMVFFAISGFLITKSIMANLRRNVSFSLREYLYARIARVYPPLIFSIALTCVLFLVVKSCGLSGGSNDIPYQVGVFPMMREVFSVTRGDILQALIMNNGLLLSNGPLWSLFIEWWIYLVVGLAVFVFTNRNILSKLLFTVVLALAYSRLLSVNSNAMFYLGIWIFGGLVALANSRFGWFVTCQHTLIFGLLLASCLLAYVAPGLVFAGPISWRVNAVQFVICAFWCALILPDQAYVNVPACRALYHLGECSFSLYLLHFPLMLFLLSVLQSAFGTALPFTFFMAVAAVVLSVAVAYFSAKWFEDKKYFLGLIRSADAYLLFRVGVITRGMK